MVATILTAIVVAIGVVGWWMSSTTPTASSAASVTTGAATNPAIAQTDSHTFIVGGEATTGSDQITVGPAPPEEVASAWLAVWCSTDPPRSDDSVGAIRDLMTARGWAEFSSTPGQTTTDLRPGLTASCDTPQARIVSRPPDTDDSVVVLVSATRTLTDATNSSAARTFRIERRQYVVRGDDGRWRVDVAAVGG